MNYLFSKLFHTRRKNTGLDTNQKNTNYSTIITPTTTNKIKSSSELTTQSMLYNINNNNNKDNHMVVENAEEFYYDPCETFEIITTNDDDDDDYNELNDGDYITNKRDSQKKFNLFSSIKSYMSFSTIIECVLNFYKSLGLNSKSSSSSFVTNKTNPIMNVPINESNINNCKSLIVSNRLDYMNRNVLNIMGLMGGQLNIIKRNLAIQFNDEHQPMIMKMPMNRENFTIRMTNHNLHGKLSANILPSNNHNKFTTLTVNNNNNNIKLTGLSSQLMASHHHDLSENINHNLLNIDMHFNMIYLNNNNILIQRKRGNPNKMVKQYDVGINNNLLINTQLCNDRTLYYFDDEPVAEPEEEQEIEQKIYNNNNNDYYNANKINNNNIYKDDEDNLLIKVKGSKIANHDENDTSSIEHELKLNSVQKYHSGIDLPFRICEIDSITQPLSPTTKVLSTSPSSSQPSPSSSQPSPSSSQPSPSSSQPSPSSSQPSPSSSQPSPEQNLTSPFKMCTTVSVSVSPVPQTIDEQCLTKRCFTSFINAISPAKKLPTLPKSILKRCTTRRLPTYSADDDSDSDVFVAQCAPEHRNDTFNGTSQLLMCAKKNRERQMSECSDDFICFESSEGDENHFIDNEYDFEDSSDDDEDDDSDTCSENAGSDTESEDEVGAKEIVGCDGSDITNNLNITREEEQLDSGFIEKKVQFNLIPKIHNMITWSYAYKASRHGPWEQHARDRFRFSNRVHCSKPILDPILCKQHRQKVYLERFIESKDSN